jgi:hypothetical protein
MTAGRRLAAIIAVNIAEYSRLIAVDEADTPKPKVGLLPAYRAANVAEYSRLAGANDADARKPQVGPSSHAVTCTPVPKTPLPDHASLVATAFRAPALQRTRDG